MKVAFVEKKISDTVTLFTTINQHSIKDLRTGVYIDVRQLVSLAAVALFAAAVKFVFWVSSH
jgi:hypothetical protein